MGFQLLPVVDVMIELYQSPINADRFTKYMKILQGNSPGNISMPVTYYNPMGKEFVLKKLLELKSLQVEEVMQDTLTIINQTLDASDALNIKVSPALADDLGGGWTNRFTTDYDSKFNVNDMFKRNFCTPLFWVSEEYSVDKIKERTADYCHRIFYRSTAPQPLTLKDHIKQEAFVANQNVFKKSQAPLSNYAALNAFYQDHKNSSSYPTIFNFLYGDSASKELGHSAYGVREEWAGYKYASLKEIYECEVEKQTSDLTV
ncbi:MAG TPA: hypothetical protein PK289_04960 [Bacteroidia bacterium]|jgi:hypothetical protein|nr:hypothetical protein [Bacteroidia bacterium]HRG52139.1 hypothetical protein [Bacteroidia bacterium]